ncbi:HD-GYP domain-containing protein [Candidatus Omnitrophota bacterium]
MPRMFDILKEKAQVDSATASAPLPQSISDIAQSADIDNLEIAQEKYDRSLSALESLLRNLDQGSQADASDYKDRLQEIAETLINQLILGDSLLEIIAGQYSSKDFLPRHSINVCIIALAMGIQMGLNKSKLHSLAAAALIHDLGMFSAEELIAQPAKLTAQEWAQVKDHVSRSLEFVCRVGLSRDQTLKQIIAQHHERANGQGYPAGLQAEAINDVAQTLGLADTYEALTHRRPYRQEKAPHHALKEIIGPSKHLFESEVIKALITKMSIYPVGSMVWLNTGDIAKVISANPQAPFNPKVLILLHENGQSLAEPKALDLSQHISINIRGPQLAE